MNLKVRKHFAVAAIGALACSVAFAQQASAVGASTNDPNSNINVTVGQYNGRISGADRFGTAVAASQALSTSFWQARHRHTVLLANAASWSDALAATPLADVLNATVLYTNPNALEAKTTTELKRLMRHEGIDSVIILGGESAISPDVATALTGLGFNVDRIGGTDRYQTAQLLAAETVDYYIGSTDLADARSTLRDQAAAQQAYTDAVAAWQAAQAKTAAAQATKADADQAVTDAANALAAATAGLVGLPSAQVLVNGTPYPVSSASLSDETQTLVEYQNAVADTAATQAFVNGVLAQYATDVQTDFTTDRWLQVVNHFGDQTFSFTLSDGVKTGTLEQLSLQVPILRDAVLSNANWATRPVKTVEAALATALTDANKAAANQQQVVGAIAQRLAEIAAANATNAAQAQKIVAANQALVAAQAKQSAAGTALAAAIVAEANAKVAYQHALNALPSTADIKRAQDDYNKALQEALAAGQKYTAFLATGQNFPDALAAGPAASEEKGVVLLTDGTTIPAPTKAYLDHGAIQVAVGGPAAAATTKESVAYVGADRYETATKLATAYFNKYQYVGLASGETAPDAVVGGAVLANVDGPIVLTKAKSLPNVTASYLAYGIKAPQLVVFGGPNAISDSVVADAQQALTH